MLFFVIQEGNKHVAENVNTGYIFLVFSYS
jgi:hypothetical protein